jgi:hypothetical protein
VANAGGLILNNRVNGVLAVTRALGDAYMKDLVTGHPYTTETVIQPDLDEFIILACDGVSVNLSNCIPYGIWISLLTVSLSQLWDVCTDQEAVDLIRSQTDPQAASKTLVEHALARFSTDNLSCMVVRLNRSALLTASKEPEAAIGVEGDVSENLEGGDSKKISEAEKIVADAKRKVEQEGGNAIGISGSNSGKGYDQQPLSPSSANDDSNPISPGPLSPNANPLSKSAATGEVPVLNEPPPPKNPPASSAPEEKKHEDLDKVDEEHSLSSDENDSKEVDLKGGEIASPETRRGLSLPLGANGKEDTAKSAG